MASATDPHPHWPLKKIAAIATLIFLTHTHIMPPALRRIASSPTVRSAVAPYPPTSPSSSTASASAVARTRPGRRRGVSDANSRRVLADIEWWRVMQGAQVHSQSNLLVLTVS